MSIQHAVVVGVDPHADTLAAAAIDAAGAVVWQATVANTTEGVLGLIQAAGNGARRWGIEGTGTFGRLLCDELLTTGARVLEVPTRLTARLRRRSGYAKTDPIDAAAIARAVLADTLGPVRHHPVVEALRVLVRQRETLVTAQVQATNRIRSRLRELDPATARELPRLRSRATLNRLTELVTDNPNPHHQALAFTIRLEAAETLERIKHIKQLDTRIRHTLPHPGHQLMTITGIGLVGAATIIANTGDINRFPTDGHYATYCGTAPLDASSGRQQRHRLNRWGNRTLNRVIHTAIITQLQRRAEAHHHITRRLSQGSTKPEAIRTAKRHLTRRIYRLLKHHPLT